ncbi:MAG: hypothetical protein GX962_07030 [Epulopiscium sp.]|nr:hypothetical protein [Candidatus Epulonipiscium sp.]
MVVKHYYLMFETVHGSELGGYPITALPIKEEIIITKSIEFFSDPNPCNFHRNAVKQRLYLEMSQYFIRCYEKGEKQRLWEEVPEDIRSYLDFRQEIAKVYIYCRG